MASTDSPKSDSGKKKRDNGDEVARRRAEAERLVALRREALKKEQEEKLRKINAQLEKDRKERARILHEKELLRQKQVLDRRQAQLEAEQAKKQAILAKAHEVASRTSKKAQNSYAFGSSTPRQLDYLTNLSREQKVYDRRLSPASPPKTVASPMTASMYAPRTQQRTPAPRLSPPKVTCSAPASNLMTQSMYAHQKSTPVRPSSAVKSFPTRDTRRGTNAKTPAPVHPAKDAQVQKKPPIPRPRKIDPPVNSSITKSAQLEQIISKSSTNTSVSDVIDEETVLESSKEGVATTKEDSGRVESTTEDSLVRFFEEKMQLLDAPASTENAKIEDSSPLSTTDESPISVISNDVPDLLLSGETDVEEKESTTPASDNNNSLQNGHSSAQNGAAELADMDFINPDGSGNLVSFVDTSENSKGEQDEVIAPKAESVANQLTENVDQDILEVSTPHFNISTLKDGSSNCNGAGNEISLKDELAFLNTDKLSSVGLSEPIPEMRDTFDKDEEKSRRDVQMLQEEEILRRQEEESRQEEEVKSQLLTKMQQEQQEREDRKARLAAIMNRTRTGGGLPVKETQANPTESSLSALQKIAQIGGSQRLQGLLQKHASNPNLEDGTQLPGAVPDDPHVIYPPALSPTQSQL